MPHHLFREAEIIAAARGQIVPGLRDKIDPGPKALPNTPPIRTTWPAFEHARADGFLLQRGLHDGYDLERIWGAWCRLHQLPFVQITVMGMRATVRLSVDVTWTDQVYTPWGIRTLAEAWRRVSAGGVRWSFCPDHCWIEYLPPEDAVELARLWVIATRDPRSAEDKAVAQARSERRDLTQAEAVLNRGEFTPLTRAPLKVDGSTSDEGAL